MVELSELTNELSNTADFINSMKNQLMKDKSVELTENERVSLLGKMQLLSEIAENIWLGM